MVSAPLGRYWHTRHLAAAPTGEGCVRSSEQISWKTRPRSGPMKTFSLWKVSREIRICLMSIAFSDQSRRRLAEEGVVEERERTQASGMVGTLAERARAVIESDWAAGG